MVSTITAPHLNHNPNLFQFSTCKDNNNYKYYSLTILHLSPLQESLITQADTVLFVVSPDSVTSIVALREIAFATSLNKRVAPVVFRKVDDVPEALGKYNFLFFDDEAQFEASADKLADSLQVDIAWVRLHTEYCAAARRWADATRPDGLLLRSPSLEMAEHWIKSRPEGAPTPTEEARTFIRLSRAFAEEEEQQLKRAIRTKAQSIVNNLEVRYGDDLYVYLTSRQLCELWNLATVEERVKTEFVSILAEELTETIRVSPAFSTISRALGVLRPYEAEAESLAIAVVRALHASNHKASTFLVRELRELTPKLTAAQASRVLDPLVQQFGKMADADAIRAQGQALLAMTSKLTDAQVGEVLGPLLECLGRITDPFSREALGQALQSLTSRLNNAQADRALDPVLRQIDEARPDGTGTLPALAEALRGLSSKLAKPRSSQALDRLLRQIGEDNHHNSDSLQALFAALGSLTPNLNGKQLGEALDVLLDVGAQARVLFPLAIFKDALDALVSKLTEQQANQALVQLLRRIGKAKTADAVQALMQGLKSLAPKLTQVGVTQSFTPLLKQLDETNDQDACEALGEGLKVLTTRLTESQAGSAIRLLLRCIKQLHFAWALRALADVLGSLATKLSEGQMAEALDALLREIGHTDNPHALQALAEGVNALQVKLTEAQARQALKPLLRLVIKWNNSPGSAALVALFDGIKSLPVKLAEAQANQMREVLLRHIDQDTNPAGLRELMRIVPEGLTEGQGNLVLDALLRRASQETDPGTNLWLAEGLLFLAPKLTGAQASRASKVAKSSLAWSALEDQATAWARALVLLTESAADRERILVTAITYPAAAGPATNVLLDAIREQRPDAPSKEEGIEVALNWLASAYPLVLLPPVCPEPPQPFEISGLRGPAAPGELQAV